MQETVTIRMYSFGEDEWPSPDFNGIQPVEMDQLEDMAARTIVMNVVKQLQRLSNIQAIKAEPHLFTTQPVMTRVYEGKFETGKDWVWISYKRTKEDTGFLAFGFMITER